jgi:hypothetical protein
MMMGDHAAPPLPAARWGIPLGRGGGLGLEHEPAGGLSDDRGDGSPLRLFPPGMAHHQLFARMISQQGRPTRRELPRGPLGAEPVMGASGPRGHGAIDMPPGLVVPGGTSGTSSTTPHGAVTGGWRHPRAASLTLRSPSPAMPPARPARPPAPRSELGRAPRARRALQAWPPGLMPRLPPGAHPLLVPIAPRRHRATALAVHPQRVGVLALPQAPLAGAAKGGPALLSRHHRVHPGHQDEALRPQPWSCASTSRA